jgi:hypothetical protein
VAVAGIRAPGIGQIEPRRRGRRHDLNRRCRRGQARRLLWGRGGQRQRRHSGQSTRNWRRGNALGEARARFSARLGSELRGEQHCGGGEASAAKPSN